MSSRLSTRHIAAPRAAAHSRISLGEVLCGALFLVVFSAATLVPWVLHVAVGWWAGLLAIPVLFWVYDLLFVPRGSLCMGIPFMFPLSSALALVAVNSLLFLRWLIQAAMF